MSDILFALDVSGDQTFCTFGFQLISIRSKSIDADFAQQVVLHRRSLINFINALYNPYRSASFIIRTIINPHQENMAAGNIKIALLVKFPVKDELGDIKDQVDAMAKNLKLLLGGNFGDYIWQIINKSEDVEQFLNPLNWPTAFVSEVRRRTESVQLDTLVPYRNVGFLEEKGQTLAAGSAESVYYVHPFSPPYRGFENLLHTLMQGQQKIVLTTILSPTALNQREFQYFQDQIAFCEGFKPSSSHSQRNQKQRASNLGEALLRQYLVLQDAPFYLTFSVASQNPLDSMLLEFIGLTLTEPIGSGVQTAQGMDSFKLHVGGYDVVIPLTEKEASTARENCAQFLQQPWQMTPLSPDLQRLRFLFDGSEAISAFYLPINTEINLPGIDTFSMDERPLPRELSALRSQENSNILIGKNHYFGFAQDVVIPEATRRQHTYIVGQTGTGKTTLMKTMILSDMLAGNGLAVIDPHGELYQDILEMIPENRKEDVVLLNPADVDFPIGFNLLEVKERGEREYVVKEMRAIFKRIFREHFGIIDQGAYMGTNFFMHVLNNMLLSMSDSDNPGTLVELKAIFDSEFFWRRWLPLKWKNLQLENWVEEILPNTDYSQKTSDGGRLGDYFSSKFEDFVNDPRINLIFGQPCSTINLAEVVESNKILLVNLSKGLLGEANSSLFGMMLMAKLNAVFMERMKHIGKKEKLNPYYLYVDEFQNIATENFSILLAEARKFGMGLILANQYLKQISDHHILNAIWGNVGTLVSFRLGFEDAKDMVPQFYPIYGEKDLIDLPNYHAIFRTNVKGERTLPCNFKTILTPKSDHYANVDEVIALSRSKYATPRNLAQFLVASSLDPQRLVKSEFYWEQEGTPEDQLLSSIEWTDFIATFEEEERFARRELNNLNKILMRQIFHYLANEKRVSREVLGQLLSGIEENQICLAKNFRQYLLEYFEPAIGDLTHEVLGIYNDIARKYLFILVRKISDLIDLDLCENEMEQIEMLIRQDHWQSAAIIIARLRTSIITTQDLIEAFHS